MERRYHDASLPGGYGLSLMPYQHLDGFHALWFARGRYGSDDYARMDRQRCTVDAAGTVTMLGSSHSHLGGSSPQSSQ